MGCTERHPELETCTSNPIFAPGEELLVDPSETDQSPFIWGRGIYLNQLPCSLVLNAKSGESAVARMSPFRERTRSLRGVLSSLHVYTEACKSQSGKCTCW